MPPSLGAAETIQPSHSMTCSQSLAKQSADETQDGWTRSFHEVIEGMTRNDVRVAKQRRREQRVAAQEESTRNEDAKDSLSVKAQRLAMMQQIGRKIPIRPYESYLQQ